MSRSRLLTIIVFGLFFLPASGCRNGGTTAMIAVIKSADQGIKAFVDWAVIEEGKIADAAIAQCKAQPSREAYDICTRDYALQKRAPIEKVKLSIRLYAAALQAAHGAQTQDVAAAANAVVSAMAAVGIYVGGGR